MLVITMVDHLIIWIMLHGCSCPLITRLGLLLVTSLLSYRDPMGDPCSGHHRSIQNEIGTCPRPVRQGRVDTLGFAYNLIILKCIVEMKHGKNTLSVPQPLIERINFLFASAHS